MDKLSTAEARRDRRADAYTVLTVMCETEPSPNGGRWFADRSDNANMLRMTAAKVIEATKR